MRIVATFAKVLAVQSIAPLDPRGGCATALGDAIPRPEPHT